MGNLSQIISQISPSECELVRIQVAYGVSLVSEEAQTREVILSYEGLIMDCHLYMVGLFQSRESLSN
jgi:hypothetical protein